jgi:cytochrome c
MPILRLGRTEEKPTLRQWVFGQSDEIGARSGSNMRRDVATKDRTAKVAVAAGLLLLLSPGALAADVELGRYLATECMTCHGVSKTEAAIPNIFGKPESLVDELLKAYREKRLPNEVMQTVASRLKDDEIAALAAYFRTAKRP